MKSMRSILEISVNLLIAIVLLSLILQPTGPVRQRFSGWKESRAARQRVERHWDEILASGSLVGAGATVTPIVEFFDYQCPACRQAHSDIERLLQDQPRAAIRYVHLPLTSIHPEAGAAALASICAEEQGAFALMHDYLMNTDEWFTDADWAAVAAAAGVQNVDRLLRCMQEPTANERLASELELADRLQITGTPTFVWPGQVQHEIPQPSEVAKLTGQQ